MLMEYAVHLSVMMVGLVTVTVLSLDPAIEEEEITASLYLCGLESETKLWNNKVTVAQWDYVTNITDENLKKKNEIETEYAKYAKEQWNNIKRFNWKTFSNADLKRRFKKRSKLGDAALPDDKLQLYMGIRNNMTTTYATGKICAFNDSTKCDLPLEPDLVKIMAHSRDPEELKHVWVEWRKEAGASLKDLYPQYVALKNEAAQLNGFTDQAAYWLSEYDDPLFEDQVYKLWDEMKPFYMQLHAYVRGKLREKYGEDVVSKKGPIPAHLLGNMWGQAWNNVFEFTKPFPDKDSNSTDVTQEMITQGYTPTKMFKVAEEFFTSVNLSKLPESFWENSIIEKPTDGRELLCHASAWDFILDQDVRIKMCSTVNLANSLVIHHEMGHIQYFLQYQHLPYVYREGANPGFHEAVGDTISLSVSTPKHLRQIGLLKDTDFDYETKINHLYLKALQKIALIPYALLIDKWRMGIFRGTTPTNNYNCEYWKLRQDLQGLEPPVDRSEDDFDAGAKYHVAGDVEYLRYFVSNIIQFQFHRALCERAGEYVPQDDTKMLLDCDIYGNTDAGNVFGDMLKMGASRPWPDAMEVLTGQRHMDPSGLLEYFKPLRQWLEDHNQAVGEYIGWEDSQKKCYKKDEPPRVLALNSPQ